MKYIPSIIKNLIKNKEYVLDTIGESGSLIYLFDDMVLKISKKTKENIAEVDNLSKLSLVLPVPKIIQVIYTKRKVYLLMSRINGDPLNAYELDTAIKISVEALNKIWSVNEYPADLLNYKDALKYVSNNVLYDYQGLIDYADEDTYPSKFKDPRELLNWLKVNYPVNEKVFLSHGDLFLPNIISDGKKVTGVIDLGFVGLFPKERDIASLIKSFSYDYNVSKTDIEERFAKEIKVEIKKELVDYFLLYDELI